MSVTTGTGKSVYTTPPESKEAKRLRLHAATPIPTARKKKAKKEQAS